MATQTKPAARKRTPAKKVKGAASSADVPPLEIWTYTPGDLLPELSNHVGRQLQVLVPARYLTTHNERVTGSQVWGDTHVLLPSFKYCAILEFSKYRIIWVLRDVNVARVFPPPPFSVSHTLALLCVSVLLLVFFFSYIHLLQRFVHVADHAYWFLPLIFRCGARIYIPTTPTLLQVWSCLATWTVGKLSFVAVCVANSSYLTCMRKNKQNSLQCWRILISITFKIPRRTMMLWWHFGFWRRLTATRPPAEKICVLVLGLKLMMVVVSRWRKWRRSR